MNHLQTQWRAGFNGMLGLDYPGVEAACRMLGRAMTPELFVQLQTCERAALDAMRAKG